MIRHPAGRPPLVALAVILAVALVAGTDGWIVRHFGAHAASDQGPDSYLSEIACPSSAACWAVGQTAASRGGSTSAERRGPPVWGGGGGVRRRGGGAAPAG